MLNRARWFVRGLQLAPLMERFRPERVLGLDSLINGFVSVAVISVLAVVFRAPFVFPSAGATAVVLFSVLVSAAASPRIVLVGHLIGVMAGWLALAVFGLLDAGSALPDQVTWARVLAAGVSLGLTGGTMALLRVTHAPAGATALIVSLGLLAEVGELAVLMLAIALLVVQATVIHRLAGLRYPRWRMGEGEG